MNEKEIHFINDLNMGKRNFFLKEFDKTIDSEGYKRKVFLREFMLALFKAVRVEKVEKHFEVPSFQLSSMDKIKPLRMKIFKPMVVDPIYPKAVKRVPYPSPIPMHQLKPAIKRALAKKILPPLKPKHKNVYMVEGNLYYSAEIVDKSYLDQVKSLLNSPGVKAVYIDGLHKPLLVDYLDYSQLLTEIEFSDGNRLNNMIKKFSKEQGVRFSKEKLAILEKLKDGSFLQANLGDDFIDPKFILKKGKIL